MKSLKNIFRKKNQEAKPLKIEGVAPTPMTPEPDESELAAQALLEKMAEVRQDKAIRKRKKTEKGSAEYYQEMAEKIRKAHETASLRTQRFLAFCEQELKKPNLPKEGPGSLGLLEAELYKRIDLVEHHGGELKSRWQHCLAMVTVRLMGINDEE